MAIGVDIGYVIIAELEIEPAKYNAFLAAIAQNAAAAMLEEPGCRHFDVVPAPAEHRVTLFECYDDRAAFERHLLTPHFQTWKAEASGSIVGKRVRHLVARD